MFTFNFLQLIPVDIHYLNMLIVFQKKIIDTYIQLVLDKNIPLSFYKWLQYDRFYFRFNIRYNFNFKILIIFSELRI